MKTIAIIGAGAAGLMTAATILENTESQDFQIHIFEKNKTPGNKIIISGGGRCNVTTSITDKKILATKYTRGWEFIKKSMGKCNPKKVYDWFESHGVPLKTQSDMRVFPISDDGNDVVDAFERVFAKYRDNIVMHYGEGVSEVSLLSSGGTKDLLLDNAPGQIPPMSEGQNKNNKKYTITTPKGAYHIDILVITTGGNAYSQTGSTGDGYAFARSLGHTITSLGPSLSSFLTSDKWLHELSGLAFESAKISWSRHSEERRIKVSGTLDPSYRQDDGNNRLLIGPILLTHFGLSGPLAFMYSSEIAWEKLDKNTPKKIHLSPIANIDEKEWDNFLKNEFLIHPKKTITSILREKLPQRFVDAFISELHTHLLNVYAASISKKDRTSIAEDLGRGIPLTLIDRRPGDEFVTAGGVSTDELDAETMESRIQENLYFAGEVLNVDGYTGGFSLQICWASGYVVGRYISDNM